MNLTEEQILSLAPDESSKKAGKDLAAPAKWLTKGQSPQALWGECQGSGSKPYQTAIDLSNLAFKCSCPSRKFPCKHGIALGLLYARNNTAFSTTEAPGWVSEWLQKRNQKEDKKTEAASKPVDEAAQAKRQVAREQKVSDGIEELLLWIKDLVRNGMLNIPEKGYAFWDGMARRMVDAQAGGLAGMIRTLGNTPFYKEGWQSLFLETLLQLYLLAKAYQNKEGLLPLQLQELRNWIGFTINQEELKQQPGVHDRWMVIGKQVTEEENITVERNWLYGPATGHYALVLQFIVRGQGSTVLLTPGMYVEAELVFYPSTQPLRALIKQSATTNRTDVIMLPSWKQVAEAETELYAVFPIRSERPYLLANITPVLHNNRWCLKDKAGNVVHLKENFASLWKLLALSGGHPLSMAVVGRGDVYQPLGVWFDQEFKAL